MLTDVVNVGDEEAMRHWILADHCTRTGTAVFLSRDSY